MNKWIWTFVVSAACLDVCFCYQCQSSMLDWESNPVACWAFRSWGITGVVLFRASLLAFAVLMSRTKTRWSWLVAPTWGVAHAYLLVTLLVAGPYVSTLRPSDSNRWVARAAPVRLNPDSSSTGPVARSLPNWASPPSPVRDRGEIGASYAPNVPGQNGFHKGNGAQACAD